jgi:LysR family hydrogen peroxide-inducible transcriptional activator
MNTNDVETLIGFSYQLAILQESPMHSLPSMRQLRYFIAVAETRHFRRAADALGISQPSLSLQIGNLETLLGTPLVERGRGPITLTPAGREVLVLARKAVDEAQAILDVTAAMRGGLTGTIRLGSSPSLGPYLLPRVVDHLHRSFPELRLYIRERVPRLLREELLDGTHDLILSQLPVQGADLHIRRLFMEPLLLVVPADHPLSRKMTIGVDDLAGLQVLTLGPEFVLHDQISIICAEYGAELVRDYEGTSLDALRQMVAMGMGVAFLPQLYVASEIVPRGAGVVAVPFSRSSFTRSIGLVWRRGSGARLIYDRIADEMIDVSRKAFGGMLRFDVQNRG